MVIYLCVFSLSINCAFFFFCSMSKLMKLPVYTQRTLLMHDGDIEYQRNSVSFYFCFQTRTDRFHFSTQFQIKSGYRIMYRYLIKALFRAPFHWLIKRNLRWSCFGSFQSMEAQKCCMHELKLLNAFVVVSFYLFLFSLLHRTGYRNFINLF